MEKVVADASVIVKWFIEEEYSDKALLLRDKHVNGDVRIAVPTILSFEVLNALKYSKLFNKGELTEISYSLARYGFEIHNLRDKFAEKTVEISIEKDITIYDASYVALAIILGTKLYTADKKLIEKTKDEYTNAVLHIKEIE